MLCSRESYLQFPHLKRENELHAFFEQVTSHEYKEFMPCCLSVCSTGEFSFLTGIEHMTPVLEARFLTTGRPWIPYRCFKAIQALYQTSLEDFMRRHTFVPDYYVMSPLATFMILSQKGDFQMVFSIWHSSTPLTFSMANKLGILVVVLVWSLMSILITEPLPLSFQQLLSLPFAWSLK